MIKLLKKKNRTPILSRILRPSASIEDSFVGAVLKLVKEMVSEVEKEVTQLFQGESLDHQEGVIERTALELGMTIFHPPPFSFTVDTNIASLATRLMERMMKKFTMRFEQVAQVKVPEMMDRSETHNAISLKKLFLIPQSNRIRTVLKASTEEAANLIKRIPQQYLNNVQGALMRSITTGNGLSDLVPELKKYKVQIRNWSENTALDQTRKAYAFMGKARMEDAGIEKFEWIHSGGGEVPRKLHHDRWPKGLNYGVFSFKDLPIIDERTGERGIPGQLPNCRCSMRAIMKIEEEVRI